MTTETAAPAAPAAPPDPYDLGDTELYPAREVEPYVPPSTTAAPAEGSGQAAPETNSTPDATQGGRLRREDGTFLPDPKHPSWLVEQAREVGLTDEDISGATQDMLGRYIQASRRQTEKIRTEFATQRTVQDAQVRPPAPAPPPPPEEDDLGVDLSDVAEPIAVALKKLAKENKTLRQQAQEQERRETQRTFDIASEKLDSALFALGPSYAKLIGDQPVSEMTTTQAEYRHRCEILKLAGVTDLKAIPRDYRTKIKAAAEKYTSDLRAALLPEEPAKTDYSEVEKPNGKSRVTEADWREGALNRPTQRKGGNEPDGTDKAVKNLSERMRERGVIERPLDGEPDSEIMDGLLG